VLLPAGGLKVNRGFRTQGAGSGLEFCVMRCRGVVCKRLAKSTWLQIDSVITLVPNSKGTTTKSREFLLYVAIGVDDIL